MREALEIRAEGHPERAATLGNTALYLHNRFEQLGTFSDLNEALALERSALELRPAGDPDRALSLANVARCLHSRFERTGMLSDLDEALILQSNALELRPEGHPHRVISLGNLAIYFHTRFKKLGMVSDLDEAISLQRDTSKRCPLGHPERAVALNNLAQSLRTRYWHSNLHDAKDIDDSFRLYSQLADFPQTMFLADLRIAKEWIKAAEFYEHGTIILAYQTFLRLSVRHIATLPSLPQHLALLKHLMTSIAVDAFSACVRHGDLTNAVALLEQGRTVFWNQLTRLRSSLDEVRAYGDAGGELAERFTQLNSLLRSVLDGLPNIESQHEQACQLSMQLQDIVTDIRKLPGLSHFLQPPLFSDLRIAAAGGPVIVVNASRYSCDALIVLSDHDPIHVPLLITKIRVSELSLELRSLLSRVKFEDVTRKLVVLLRELWDTTVLPITRVLQESYPHRSRIWWCPTAEFSLLPLHAAGSYRKGQPKLSDLYISSYTPTLTALIRARQHRPSDSSAERPRILLVGQTRAPGQNRLLSVDTELSNVSQCVEGAAKLTCLQDKDATIAQVTQALNASDFVHLACHGIPDWKRPFESGFALENGLLKVEDIMRYDLQRAQFAYLSACHTTVGDEESPDEVIHLAAAMQFAGFRSVIGTMWAVDDAHTNAITSAFYEHMVDDETGRFDYTRAAWALHRTMRRLRSDVVPFDQRILYVHMGA